MSCHIQANFYTCTGNMQSDFIYLSIYFSNLFSQLQEEGVGISWQQQSWAVAAAVSVCAHGWFVTVSSHRAGDVSPTAEHGAAALAPPPADPVCEEFVVMVKSGKFPIKEIERKPSAPLAAQFLCQRNFVFCPGSSLKASVHFPNKLVRARLSPQKVHPLI